MSTAPGFLESLRAKYPAMQPDERLVWRKWLEIHQGEYDRFDYNVHIGIEQDVGPTFPDFARTAGILLRQKRLDALGYKGAQPTIFEVKRRAGPENIGQLLVYLHWFPVTFPTAPAPALRLVAGDADPHLAPVLAKLQIPIDIVPGVDYSVLRLLGSTPPAP